MRIFCHKRRGKYIFMLLFVVITSSGILGCDRLLELLLPEDDPALLGWSEETHGDEATPDYATVFDQTAVKRIDIVFQPDNWQALLDNMTELFGTFGQSRGFGFGSIERPDWDSAAPPGMPPGMGEEMLAACEGKAAEDSCVVTMGGDEVDGTCIENPMMGTGLTCRPNNFNPFGRPTQNVDPDVPMEMPPGMGEEMAAACEGKAAEDSCVVTMGGDEVDGTCVENPMMGTGLTCRPNNFNPFDRPTRDGDQAFNPENVPDGPPGMPRMPEEILTACEGREENDACAVTLFGNEMDGTCSQVPMVGDGLICIPDEFGDMEGPPGMDMMEGRDPIFKPCTVNFEGRTWQNVGMRFKGNSSLMSSWGGGSNKLPFRLDFDEFEDDYPDIKNQRFYGFDKLTFSSGWTDNSLVREKVVADIFREAGVPAARTASYRVYIDYGEGPVYFGLYTMVEDPNGPMLDEQFGDDDGNLYKPNGRGATFSQYNQDSFIKKTNQDDADWSDVKALFDALQADRGDAAAWREGLETVLDVNNFLQYLAINTVVTNWDTYGRMSHNYYLYNDPNDGLLHWIPWDNNMALSRSGMGGGAMPLALDTINDSWPLIRFLMDDPVYRATYRFFVKETIDGAFSAEKTRVCFTKAHTMVAPYAIGPEGEQEGYTLLSSAEAFEQELDRMLAFADQRRLAALQFLEDEGFSSSTIVINELHYHPAVDEDQDEDDYEFIELTNTGTQAIDLSGYAFVSGIDFTFPEGVSIAPGEYLLVCKKAEIYTGKADQVFEWESGKLSNNGEILQLNDMNGIIADVVRYTDQGYWPENADGNGASLELRESTAANSLAENWKAVTAGGSPGQSND